MLRLTAENNDCFPIFFQKIQICRKKQYRQILPEAINRHHRPFPGNGIYSSKIFRQKTFFQILITAAIGSLGRWCLESNFR